MRVAGVTLQENKRLDIALTGIYGIGRPLAKNILKSAGVSATKRPSEVTSEEENKLKQIIETYKIEGNLKREVSGNIKRLVDIKAYRGSRHSRLLPARGQRTKTNSRTRRGNVRKTMGSGRKKLEKK